jgi:ribA/ribD-fused uncharacterized protein
MGWWEKMTIEFYKVNEKYGEFSNFSSFNIYLLGTTWKTTEHYFQARKFHDSNIVLKIMDATSPKEAAWIGRDLNNKIRNDWELIKIDVMREAIYAKFTQHNCLRELLLSTNDELIIEASPYDYFWGEGAEKTGKNYLGQILMEVRGKIKLAPKFEVIAPWDFNSEAEPYDFFWSQGKAEDILVNWYTYIKSLSSEEKKEYIRCNSIPESWGKHLK